MVAVCGSGGGEALLLVLGDGSVVRGGEEGGVLGGGGGDGGDGGGLGLGRGQGGLGLGGGDAGLGVLSGEAGDGAGLLGPRAVEAGEVGAAARVDNGLDVLELGLRVALEVGDVGGEDEVELGRAADLVPVNLRHAPQVEALDGPVEPLHVR